MNLLVHADRVHNLMAEEFLSDDFPLPPPPYCPPPSLPREPVRIVVVGSPRGIDIIVHTLHLLRFANADGWSRVQPEPNTGQMMRILTKYVDPR